MRSVVPLAALTVVLAPSFAFAHKMIVVAKVAETIRVEVGYEDGTPTEGATVTLKDEAGTVVVEGVTDETGVCVLPRPKPGQYLIIANDGGGHRRQQQLSIPDENATSETRETQSFLNRRWVRSVIGVSLIGAVTVLVWWVRRRR